MNINDVYDLKEKLYFTVELAKDQIEFFRSIATLIQDGITIKHKHVWDYKWTMMNTFKFLMNDPSMKIDSFNRMIKNINDITQLIWRVHMLNPQSYYKDCIESFGFINPFMIDQNQSRYALLNTDSFVTNANTIKDSDDVFARQKKIFSASIDIESAVNRQIKFINKMNDIFDIKSNMDNIEEKLEKCLLRYCTFLFLHKEKLTKRYNDKNDFVLVPRLDMDLVWHSHQLNPVSYHNICLQLFGIEIFHHNDNIEETVLNTDRIKTESFWNATYENNNNNNSNDDNALDSSYSLYMYTNDAFVYTYQESTEEKIVTSNVNTNTNTNGNNVIDAMNLEHEQAREHTSRMYLEIT